MPAFQWTYIICCLIQLATSQSVDQFTISTTAAHPGDDATNLEVTLYWGNNSYNCSFPTSTTTQAEYNCNDQAPWSPVEISQDYTLPYYLQFKWMTGGDVATSFIEIDAINVTLDNGFWYAIDHFCIHSMMSCTSGLSSTQKCGQWSSKDEYNTFKMGSTTNFQLLYVDFRSNITGIPNFANIIHEGSVRPPNLVQLGLTTQQTYDADAVSAQWDNKYYRCTGGMTFTDSVGNWTCDITESKTCPGVNSSFWWSIHNDATGVAETITVTGVQVTDETGTTYRMSQWCHPLEDPFYTNAYSNCTELTPYIHYTDPIPVGGMFVDVSQVAFIAPDYAQQFSCLFAYPDVYEPNIDIAVLSADGGMKGWGHDKYGGTTDIVCPITPGPTTYPTTSPTFEPTSEPTWEPTFEPTFVPTSNPTFHPTADPTFEPTVQPTHDPTNDPTSDPTEEPTFQPTKHPSFDPTFDPTHEPTTGRPSIPPTKAPSKLPTVSPTKFPTVSAAEATDAPKLVTKTNIFWAIIALVVFLFCCLCFFMLIYMKRKKEKKEESQSTAPVAAPTVYAARSYHKKEDTYNAYEIGAINTMPSMHDEDDDHYGGQYEAKQEVELEQIYEKQYTLDGVAAGTVTGAGDEKGNEAVLNMLADGHETGANPQIDTDQTDDVVQKFETAEYTV